MGTKMNLLINLSVEVSFSTIVSIILLTAMVIFPVLFITFHIRDVKQGKRFIVEKELLQEALDKLCRGMTREEVRALLPTLKPNVNIDDDTYSTTNGNEIFKLQIIYRDDIVTNVNGSTRKLI